MPENLGPKAQRIIRGSELGPQVFLGRWEPHAGKFAPPEGWGRCEGVKPTRGGLWTSSPTDEISGWAEWCASEDFGTGSHELYTLTPDPHAELAQIDSYDDLAHWHHVFGRSEQIGNSSYRRYRLDYGLIAERYAGVHLTEEGQWRTRMTDPYNLYGWDCESTLWCRWAFVKVEHGGTVYVGRETADAG